MTVEDEERKRAAQLIDSSNVWHIFPRHNRELAAMFVLNKEFDGIERYNNVGMIVSGFQYSRTKGGNRRVEFDFMDEQTLHGKSNIRYRVRAYGECAENIKKMRLKTSQLVRLFGAKVVTRSKEMTRGEQQIYYLRCVGLKIEH